ncbi:MAG: hypothetical protein RIC19_14980 [Phaeodactylibacter sp.]|uniref:hypothetical protein n=1 Tax=Phaeodactylibacter sp. TaxID=1940289 RepID=UPI0032EE3A36
MTNREIRGIAGQLFLVFLSMLPMYFLSEQSSNEQTPPSPKETVESYSPETA